MNEGWTCTFRPVWFTLRNGSIHSHNWRERVNKDANSHCPRAFPQELPAQMKQCDVSERLTPQAGPLTNHAHAAPAFTPPWRLAPSVSHVPLCPLRTSQAHVLTSTLHQGVVLLLQPLPCSVKAFTVTVGQPGVLMSDAVLNWGGPQPPCCASSTRKPTSCRIEGGQCGSSGPGPQ